MTGTRVAAIDLGATSGRVVVLDVDDAGRVSAEVTARFPNGPREVADRLVWDIPELHRQAMAAVTTAHGTAPLSSVGIDSWAVDFGITDSDGSLIGPVYAYRDANHEKGFAIVDQRVSWPEQYAIAGIQRLPFNTIYQLAADEGSVRLATGAHMLLVPDLLGMWITGNAATELTNASHTAMLDARTRTWSPDLVTASGVRPVMLSDLQHPGTVRGEFRTTALTGLPLITVGSHDTASAFAAVPIHPDDHAAVVSLGTWALVGTHVPEPIVTAEAREANFTNELAVDGGVRFLRNVTGMWILEELRRELSTVDGREVTIPEMLAAAQDAPPFDALINPDDPLFAPPGLMIGRIQGACAGSVPTTTGQITRCVLESMVARIADRIELCAAIVGQPFTAVHVVGGGAQNTFILQWLADALDLPLIAGPAEATAFGNAIVQWKALGVLDGLAAGRALVRGLPEIRMVEPNGGAQSWAQYIDRQRTWAQTERS